MQDCNRLFSRKRAFHRAYWHRNAWLGFLRSEDQRSQRERVPKYAIHGDFPSLKAVQQDAHIMSRQIACTLPIDPQETFRKLHVDIWLAVGFRYLLGESLCYSLD